MRVMEFQKYLLLLLIVISLIFFPRNYFPQSVCMYLSRNFFLSSISLNNCISKISSLHRQPLIQSGSLSLNLTMDSYSFCFLFQKVSVSQIIFFIKKAKQFMMLASWFNISFRIFCHSELTNWRNLELTRRIHTP